jgi:hypothetical protein
MSEEINSWDRTECVVERQYFGRRYGVFVFGKSRGKHTVAKSVTLQIIENEADYASVAREPLFYLDTHYAQQLMDSLWQAGLRPSEGAGSAGAMAAVEKHLADMRTIAFRGLGMKSK